jgi:PAS domain-containing protein
MSNSSKPTRFEARLQSSGKAGGGNKRLTPRLPRTAGGAHKLFARQVAEARTTTGHIDLTRLGKLVMAAYQGMERDRRRTNRSISLMAKERERHLSDRERAAELLRVQKRQLDTALNNMRHGLLMFDPDSRVVVINQSYLKMYGLSPEQAKPGCTARELLELRAANGTFAGDIDAYLTSQIIQGGKVDTVFEIPDGRSIRVVNRFMDGGGWVSIHEEVTRQRKAEVALEKALAESARAEKEATAAPARCLRSGARRSDAVRRRRSLRDVEPALCRALCADAGRHQGGRPFRGCVARRPGRGPISRGERARTAMVG